MGKPKPDIDPSLYKLGTIAASKVSVSLQSDECPLHIVKQEFNDFEDFDWDNNAHRKAFLDIAPQWLYEEAHEIDRARFHNMVRHDPDEDCLVAGCFDEEFNLLSCKHRHRWGKKWVTRKGTHPNRNLFIRILRTRNTPVYVVEGHRDALTAVLLGLNCIMIPFAGFRLQNPIFLITETNDKELIFIAEDETAYRCMKPIAEQLTLSAKDISIIELGNTAEKLDLSDYIQQFNSIQEVINGLRNRR